MASLDKLVRDEYSRALGAFFEARELVADRIDKAGRATDDQLQALYDTRAKLEQAREACHALERLH